MTDCIKPLLLCLALALAVDVFAQNVDELKARAATGDKIAMRELAETYFGNQDYAQAAQWYAKAAKAGDRKAQTSLGLMYARGYGVEKDIGRAYKWWSFAAAQNDPGAQYDLGNLYFSGEGIKQDYAQAAHWYREAAQRGHIQAQENLAMLYFDGKGVEKNIPQAYYLTKLAVLQGSDDATELLKKIAPYLTAEQIQEGDAKADDWLKSGKKIWRGE